MLALSQPVVPLAMPVSVRVGDAAFWVTKNQLLSVLSASSQAPRDGAVLHKLPSPTRMSRSVTPAVGSRNTKFASSTMLNSPMDATLDEVGYIAPMVPETAEL